MDRHAQPDSLNNRSVEELLGNLEAVVFADEGTESEKFWQGLLSAKASRKLLGRLFTVAGATLFTCVPVCEDARRAAQLSDAGAIRGSGDRRGHAAIPRLQSSPLIESRQQAADMAVAVRWASTESRKLAERCVKTWLTALGHGAPASPAKDHKGLVTASLHELLPQALSAVKAQLPVPKPSSKTGASLPATRSIAIVRSMHWLMQQCDYLVLKDRVVDCFSCKML